jgi:hypothetical protein
MRELSSKAAVGWLVRRALETAFLALALALSPLVHAQLPAAEADAGVEPSPDAAADSFRQLVDSDPFAGDAPIGGDDGHADPLAAEGTEELRTAALPAEDAVVGERLPIVRGEILAAVAGVRETEHLTRVELVAGLALVRTELRFESSARYAAEIGYRIAVPAGAVPFALEVCREDGVCRAGALEAGTARTSAYDAALVATGPIAQDSRPIGVIERAGEALVVRAAPVPAGGVGGDGSTTRGVLVVRVGYAVPVPVRGGVARLTLPSRGSDVRAATELLSLSAVDLVVPELDGVEVGAGETIERRPAQAASIVAHVPRTWSRRDEAWTAPCASERCVWLRASSPRPSTARQDVVLAIDASPSTGAGARGLVPEAALSLLASLPAGSRARVVAFAARAEGVVDAWTDAASIEESALRRATELELGSATRFEALWAHLSPSIARGAVIVWIGDGGLTSSDESARALEEARTRGVSVRFVSVADRESSAALRAAAERFESPIIEAHDEALLATRNRREALDERLASVVAAERARRVVLRAAGNETTQWLEPGGAVTSAGRTRGRGSITVDGAAVGPSSATGDLALAIAALASSRPDQSVRLVAAEAPPSATACTGEQTVLHGSSALVRVTALPNRFAVVERRTCREAPSAAPRTERRSALSRAALLRTLRQRIIPRARDCFRSDRRGRAEYSTQVELVLTLADMEVIDVRADGAIDPALRACMMHTADTLEVAPFEGVILVRWPLYSRPEMPPPTLELHPDLATAVDTIGAAAE